MRKARLWLRLGNMPAPLARDKEEVQQQKRRWARTLFGAKKQRLLVLKDRKFHGGLRAEFLPMLEVLGKRDPSMVVRNWVIAVLGHWGKAMPEARPVLVNVRDAQERYSELTAKEGVPLPF